MIHLIFGLLLGLNISGATAQGFRGSITFERISLSDTVHYVYHVKDQFIRVDQLDSKQKTQQITIVNTKEQSITVINPDRKLYMPVTVRPFSDLPSNDYEIIKTENSKRINGYVCYQWRIRNRKKNTEVAYWVANDEFNFFTDLLRLMNKTEKIQNYYLQIPGATGFLPMHSVERSLLRDIRMQYKVLNIQKGTPDASLFTIPVSYTKFSK